MCSALSQMYAPMKFIEGIELLTKTNKIVMTLVALETIHRNDQNINLFFVKCVI